MKIFGIAGHSGMGKTTLLERLVPEIAARGLVVSLIKHSHKNIDIDRPGKDSYRLRESGCKEVLLLGNDRWALMHELRGASEPPLDYLLDRMQHCTDEAWRLAGGRRAYWRCGPASPSPTWKEKTSHESSSFFVCATSHDSASPSHRRRWRRVLANLLRIELDGRFVDRGVSCCHAQPCTTHSATSPISDT